MKTGFRINVSTLRHWRRHWKTIAAIGGETREEAAIRIASEVSEKAAKGEDFGQLAKTYSHGHRRAYGGLWSPLSPGSLAPPYDVLAKQAQNMQVGQVSEPIQKDGHVFVLKLEQRTERNVRQFNEVRDSLEEELRTQKRKKLEEAIRQE